MKSMNGRQAGASTPASADIRAELDQILASPGFARADRLSQFLRFVIERSLNKARPEELKESVIGIEVYGRKPGYDSRADPTVRVEATKLRARLQEYYRRNGKASTVVIELPKGAYVPIFRMAEHRTEHPSRLSRAFVVLAVAAVLAIVAAAVVVWKRTLPSPVTSIAVLPFLNLSPDPSDEYLSDGLTEELIQSLGLLDELRVISQTSSFALKGKRLEASEVASRLRAQYLVEGSVSKSRDQFRISARLVRVPDDSQIWSRTYEFPAGDLFTIQQGIARDVSNALRVKLSESSQGAVPKRRANDPEAYLSYLKGRYFWNKFEPGETWKALGYFEHATALDPAYGPAYAGIAYCYQRLLGYQGSGLRLTAAEGYPKMKAAAEKALEIDPLQAEAHAVLGVYHSRLHQWRESERRFQRALKIDSSNALIRSWYASAFLSQVGRSADAIREMRRSFEIDPLSADNDAVFADILFEAGRDDEAMEWCRKALELNSDFPRAHWQLGRIYIQQGNYSRGIQELLKAEKRMEREKASVWLGYAYAMAGQRDEALQILERTLALRLPGVAAAIIYTGLGDKDRAFEQLQDTTNFNPRQRELASLRSDARFAALLKRINLQ
jgi:adenylate cyclase